jgi:hypothetical protein
MPVEAVNLIDRLMTLNPLQRLGYGAKGSDNDYDALKNHSFFKGVDFAKIQNGKIAPPIN